MRYETNIDCSRVATHSLGNRVNAIDEQRGCSTGFGRINGNANQCPFSNSIDSVQFNTLTEHYSLRCRYDLSR